MNKQITIIQKNASPIIIEDSDDRSISEYTAAMTTLFESNNVTMIHTSSCSVISRPNAITSIVVREFPSNSLDDSQKGQQEEQQTKKNPIEENSEDGIISD